MAACAVALPAASATLADYTPATFNGLRDIRDVGLLDLTDHAKQLGAVIAKHGLTETVGVARLHNHFKLTDDEVLLVRVRKGRVDLEATAASDTERAAMIPYMFAWDADSRQLAAVQFHTGARGGSSSSSCSSADDSDATSDESKTASSSPSPAAAAGDHAAVMVGRLQTLLAAPAFIKEFVDTLVSQGTCGTLGLHLIFHDLVGYDMATHNLTESTHTSGRVQAMVPLSLEEQAERPDKVSVITHWTFNPLPADKRGDGKTLPSMACDLACESWQHDMGPQHMVYCGISDH